jgi:hypothetical protein
LENQCGSQKNKNLCEEKILVEPDLQKILCFEGKKSKLFVTCVTNPSMYLLYESIRACGEGELMA